MKKTFAIQILISAFFIISCDEVKINEKDHKANYKNIFNENTPSSVRIINSIFLTYPTGSIGGPTPDWEIEMIVPKTWIDEKIKKMNLKKINQKSNREDWCFGHIKERIKNRGREWYVPKEISEYDCYYLSLTSIPYVHMLVDKSSVEKDQFRVFLSKH